MSDARDEFRKDTPALKAALRVGAITEDERALLAALRRKGVDAGRLLPKIDSLDTALDEVARLDAEALEALRRIEADDEQALLAEVRRLGLDLGALAGSLAEAKACAEEVRACPQHPDGREIPWRLYESVAWALGRLIRPARDDE